MVKVTLAFLAICREKWDKMANAKMQESWHNRIQIGQFVSLSKNLLEIFMSELFQKTVSSRARNTYTVLSFVVNQNAECGKEGMEVLLTQVGHIQK